MLSSLHIENIAVIKCLDIDFSQGFSVLTGETGAGKSIIIDSINLLMGSRTAKELIRTGETSATVNAIFDTLSENVIEKFEENGIHIEDGSVFVQRTIYNDGKSRTKMNGQNVTITMQKELMGYLVSIHGQTDSQKILQKSSHLLLLDAFCKPEKELNEYREIYHALKKAKKELDSLSMDESEKMRRKDMLKFQLEEINNMKLKPGEEETLAQERDRLQHLEKINHASRLVYKALHGGEKMGALNLIERSEGAIEELSNYVEGTETLLSRLATARSEIEDIAELVLGYADDCAEDPTTRIDRIEDRLQDIRRMEKKYGADIESVLSYRDKIQKELDNLNSSEELIQDLTQEIKELEKKTIQKASVLTKIRQNAAGQITKEVTDSLKYLDMPKVQFEVSIQNCECNENGMDDVEFLIATNAGEPLQSMIAIASGGELSRIMLALRSVLNDKDGASTVIFDEIDTGISGKTSRKVGIRLHETANNTQVLCVTHSAQIASLADVQYLITKQEKEGRAETAVHMLSPEERVEEIARILGGISITEVQRQAAREMLQNKNE